MESNSYCSSAYRHSAIARLLVKGNLADGSNDSQGINSTDNEPPLDLSLSPKHKPEQNKNTANRKRKCSCPSDDYDVIHHCPVCPYVANDMRSLYIHYQYHMPTMSSPVSWASPDRDRSCIKDKDVKASVPLTCFHGDLRNGDSASTLRTLLQPSSKSSEESQPTPRYLTSLVQNIIKQRTPLCSSGQSSRCSSRSLTPLPGSQSSSRISSPSIARKLEMSMAYHLPTTPNIQSQQGSPEPSGQVYRISVPNGNNHSASETETKREIDSPVFVDSGNDISTPKAGCQDPPKPEYIDGQTLTHASHGVHDLYSDRQHFIRYKGEIDDDLATQEDGIPGEPQHFPNMKTIPANHDSSQVSFLEITPRPYSLKANHTSEAQVQCELASQEVVNCTLVDSATGGTDRCRCHHCGITFDDEIIFSIHMGCHYHRHPFTCNVCGRSCENKYAFYTHIMRGHEYS